MNRIFTNHIGYDADATKTAVFEGKKGMNATAFSVIRVEDGEVVYNGTLVEVGEVDNWKTGYYFTIRFDELKADGEYYISIKSDNEDYRSFPFKIEHNLLEMRTLSTAGYYFKAQRPTGEFEAGDRALPFRGEREGCQDVRGGWFDATGDIGIHFSHLSHTTYFNPQQAAFSAYAFFKFHDLLEESKYPYYTYLKRRMLDEAMYGADFVMRMRAPSGSFFRSKGRGDAFLPLATSRFISYEFRQPKSRKGGGVLEGFDEIKDENYETSFRSGGGYAIATLAYAARTTFPSDYPKEEYIKAAVAAYNYLEKNNERYTNDGKWNLIDEYCALDALVELYKTTREWDYMRKAGKMAERIMDRYVAVDDTMGYLSVNGTKRPFFHAADAGMPIVNLLNYYQIEIDKKLRARALDIATKVMRHELAVTKEASNPFGYARQLIQDGKGTIETRFFYPHDVETAPWWQGENARIASLATAARYMTYHTNCDTFKAELNKYADDQINWVLGLNPYDSCMMEGVGRNTNAYFYEERKDFIHCPGGIVNGITGGLEDEEHGISFITKPTTEIKDNWRWAEQWIPHATWFMYALTMKKI
ncbi:glycoside hydrolase family 9 protein [Paludicola sp. MB14-C6]|uniref:glycoside hydrolase family 9 protein n=1 Tax=Paludihabitans sp. MB14-C6 TaxID=3070656 RepID=UPI0027DE27FF|nr:glycoside hydrolase family 9 protein [Paludicola sp. MB14-C6]WMJ21885.1 glycoside hydrolase family 9 protein [Paludicola sp. MB14-C6]